MSRPEQSIEPIAVSPRVAAGMLGLGVTSFYSLVKAGDIPIKKVGRRSIVSVEVLKDYVKQLENA